MSTPGKWRVAHGGIKRVPVVVSVRGREVVTIARCQPLGDAEANARLIAAAPELLAALSELAHVSRSYLAHMDAEDIAALDAARAALAKARGETP